MFRIRVSFWFFFQALVIVQPWLPTSQAQLTSSESRILLQIQQNLEYPDALKSWNQWASFCSLPSTPSMAVVCSGSHVTELTIVGNRSSSQRQGSLSRTFSIESLFTDITKLSSLKKLTLSQLGIWGTFPSKINRLSSLEKLNLSSNFVYGEIPPSIASLNGLKSIDLNGNLINGSVPDLSGLKTLEEIDLGSNRIGPEFPNLGFSLVHIALQNNSIRSEIPTQFKKLNVLQWLDLSNNRLVGPIPSFIFSLPALWYLDLAGNQLTGAITKSTSCGGKLWNVDISRNLLIGKLPSCLGSRSLNRMASSWNCLSGAKNQHSLSYCQRGALAVNPPGKKKNARGKAHQSEEAVIKLGIVVAIIGGIVVVGGVVIGVLVMIICRRRGSAEVGGKTIDKPTSASAKTSARSTAPLVNSKYMSRTLRMPALSLPSFHDFTLEELEEATDGFDSENLVKDDGIQGQLYKGMLRSGTTVLIKSIKLKQKHSLKSLKQHMEVVSQFRHQNLVSVIGHCIVMYQDKNNKGSTIFVVLESVPNGSLKDHLRDWRRREALKWPQRMTISMGIARGVHFLHTGMAPHVFGSDLKIENVVLDESLTPKVGSYRIPLPPKEAEESPSNADAEKDDIYKLGTILIELLTGKAASTPTELYEIKEELERSLGEAAPALQQAVDPALQGTFAHQSLKTAVEIAISCIDERPSSRPSMEDVVWHLQYSIQAQQNWTTSGNLGLNSGNLGTHLQK